MNTTTKPADMLDKFHTTTHARVAAQMNGGDAVAAGKAEEAAAIAAVLACLAAGVAPPTDALVASFPCGWLTEKERAARSLSHWRAVAGGEL